MIDQRRHPERSEGSHPCPFVAGHYVMRSFVAETAPQDDESTKPSARISAVGAAQFSPVRKDWENNRRRSFPLAAPFPRAFDLLARYRAT